MLVMDMPDLPPQYPQVMIAQAGAAKQGAVKTDRSVGSCHLIENPPVPPESAVNMFDPTLAVWTYLKKLERPTPKWLTTDVYNAAKVSVLEGPNHGALKSVEGGVYRYTPVRDYYGQDRTTLLVEIGNLKVTLIYFFKVLHGVGGGDQDPYKDKRNCPKGEMWRISLDSNAARSISG